jgi:hypothetical protein
MAPGKTPSSFFPQVSEMLYDDTVGIANMYGGGLSEVDYSVMQLDGTTDGRAFFTGVDHFILDQQGTGWLAADTLGQNVYGFDIQAGTLTPPAPLVSGAVAMTNRIIVRCLDRYLRSNIVAGVLTLEANDLTLSGSWTTEATLSGFGSSGVITPSRDSPSGTGLYLSSSGTTGEVCHYDTGTKTFSGGFSYLPQNLAAWYSSDLAVFIAILGPNTAPSVGVYATAPEPDALSNPAVSGGITAGDLATVSVTLTGSNGEPCPNELITWVLTDGDGELVASQSATDATGKATIGYLPPFVVVTDPTIEASVNF